VSPKKSRLLITEGDYPQNPLKEQKRKRPKLTRSWDALSEQPSPPESALNPTLPDLSQTGNWQN